MGIDRRTFIANSLAGLLVLGVPVVGVLAAPRPAFACAETTGGLIWRLVKPFLGTVGNLGEFFIGEDGKIGSLGGVVNFLRERAGSLVGKLRDLIKDKRSDDAIDEAFDWFRENHVLGREWEWSGVREWIVEKGGWRWLWTELDRIAPIIAQVLYREDGDEPDGLVLDILRGLFEQGRISEPTLAGLVDSWSTIQLTEADALYFGKRLAFHITTVEESRRRFELSTGEVVETAAVLPDWSINKYPVMYFGGPNSPAMLVEVVSG